MEQEAHRKRVQKAQARWRKKNKFVIPSEYRIELSYEGYDRAIDHNVFKEASKVVGGRGYSVGSGYCFYDGRRDHGWVVKDKDQAKRLSRALSRLKLPKICVTIQAPPKVLIAP